MKLASVLTVLTALLLRNVPSPFWRYRQRFYVRVKNSGLVLSSRLRHSNVQVHLDIGDWVQYWMYMDGAYEKEMVDYLEPEVRGRIFLDIGANVGNYTLTLCRSARHIYAFEASMKNVETLTRAVRLVGDINNVTILHNAVSSISDKTVKLFLSEDASGNHSQFLRDSRRSEDVATLSLDDFVLRYDVNDIAVIKMDVEGAEFVAVEGGKRLLKQNRPVMVVEFNREAAEKAGWQLEHLYEILRQIGYRAYWLRDGEIEPFVPGDMDTKSFSDNVIFRCDP